MVKGKPYCFLLIRIENGNVTRLHVQPVDQGNEMDGWILYEDDEPYLRKHTWDNNDHTFVFEFSDITSQWEELSYTRALRFPVKTTVPYPEYLVIYAEPDPDGIVRTLELAAADTVEEAYETAKDLDWIGVEGSGRCLLYTYCYGNHGSGMDSWEQASFPVRLQRTYADGTELRFVEGSFDHYCVEILYGKSHARATQTWWPTNTWLHSELLTYPDGHQLWHALLMMAEQASPDTCDLTTFERPIIKGTIEEQLFFDSFFACMIAEERKTARDPKKNPLGKRIKLLGAFLVLFEQWSPSDAADLRKVDDGLEQMCRERGF